MFDSYIVTPLYRECQYKCSYFMMFGGVFIEYTDF